jgi:polar amino acid transport system substrate-binding protein
MNATKGGLAEILWAFVLIFLSCGLAHSQDGLQLMTEDYPPLNYVEDGHLKGPSVDIVIEIQKILNQTTTIEVYPWARGYKLIEYQDNMALFSTARTPQRENLFKWVGPLAIKKYAFFARKGSGIKLTNIHDAKSFMVGVQRDGVNDHFLQAEGFTKIDRVTSPVQNLKKLVMGRIDLWYVSSSTGAGICKQNNVSCEEIEELYDAIEELHIAKRTKFYIAFSRNTEKQVIKSWQSAYNELFQDRTIHKIFSKYSLSHLAPTIQ